MRFLQTLFIFVILMSIGLVLAEQTGSYSDHLTISKTTNGVIVVEGKTNSGSFCGDGILQLTRGEQCDKSNLGGQTCVDRGYKGGSLSCQSNCLYDTSGCTSDQPVTPSGGSGGSGGSGSSSGGAGSSKCIESWNCTEWTPCTDGIQERICVDKNKCGTTLNRPLRSIECDSGISQVDTTDDKDERKLSGITGAVIGALGSYSFWLILIFLIIIVGLYLFVSSKKKKANVSKKPLKKIVRKV